MDFRPLNQLNPEQEEAEAQIRARAAQRLADLKQQRAEERTEETFNRVADREQDGGWESIAWSKFQAPLHRTSKPWTVAWVF